MGKKNNLDISKITTGVAGFDDLFYGGFRLPGWRDGDKGRNGICIVIYGDRGISKSDLAMQIMRGVDEYFSRLYGENNRMTPMYKTLNHQESELKKKYIGLEVGSMIDNIKLPDVKTNTDHFCKICSFFPKIREVLSCVSTCPQNVQKCGSDEMTSCPICKLIRHEIINYSDRSQSLHWTFGDISDSNNLLDHLKDDIIDIEGVFCQTNEEVNSTNYQSIAHKKFKNFQKEISDKADNASDSADRTNVNFAWSSYVIEGFTSFNDDELLRLPFSDLIIKMRRTSAVSILVLDERGGKLHLNADIIIHMRKNMDVAAQYTYYELQIEKSDLQQHVHGWHKYRKLRNLSVKIYPSIHSLLAKRFSSDNAILRMERDNMRYPQSLLNRFQNNCARQTENEPVNFVDVINNVMGEGSNSVLTHSPENTKCEIELIDELAYKGIFKSIFQQAFLNSTTIAVFLLGKTEQYFRKQIQSLGLSKNALMNIHYWETSIGCIWAEEYTSIIKDYIFRWKKLSKHNNLHVIIDDLANLNLYPLMNRERLFIPAIANICKSASAYQGFEGNNRGISIQLSFVCTDENTPQYKIINQIVNNQ